MPLKEVAERRNRGLGNGEAWCFVPPTHEVSKMKSATTMKSATGTHKRLLAIIIILSSCQLMTSGALLPNPNHSGRLWKYEISQYPPPGGTNNPKDPNFPLKWMSSDVMTPQEEDNDMERQNTKARLQSSMSQESPSSRGEKVALYPDHWVPGWNRKRTIVVADDTAFREKSKMLTDLERQKWLASYMEKLMVVTSK